MLNRLTNSLPPAGDDYRAGPQAWGIDEQPELRLGMLFAGICLALLAVGGRMVYVQGFLGPSYAVEYDKTVEKLEPIPSHDGRISTADGEVLAQDVEVFNVNAHYRWIEEPPDPAWLKQQVLSRLDRAARRKPECVAAEVDNAVARRNAMWQRLADVTRIGPGKLLQQRRDVQRRVARILDRAVRRQAGDLSSTLPNVPSGSLRGTGDASADLPTAARIAQTSGAAAWWNVAWNQLVKTLTTPPERTAAEPLIVEEQLGYHLVAADVPKEVAIEIEAHAELYPGLRVELSTRRTYPQGTLAPHLVGYRAPIDERQLAERRKSFPQGDPLDYRPGDRVGLAGLELYYERHLRGLRGLRKITFNRRGEVIRTETLRDPRPGQDLVLTLHVPLQRAAERLLDETLSTQSLDETTGKPLPIPPGGSLIALDIRTGAVLAAASAPGYDLNLFVEPDAAAWRRIQSDPRKPLFSRATQMTLPPGSVFKVLSAIAFLQSGKLNPEQNFACQGYLHDPDHYRCYTFTHQGVGHGDVNLVDALARSCNVYFFDAAGRVGAAPLYDWAARFGFGRPTGIDLPGERAGNLPAPRLTARGRAVLSGDTLRLAIGQAKLTATPLQVVRMLAAVANGGLLVAPRLVDNTGPKLVTEDVPGGGSELEGSISLQAAEPIPDLTRQSLEWVRMGLQQVVAHPQGTGYKTVRLKEVAIAGKTGTAEPGGTRPDHAWFAGYVPAGQPRIAFVVVLEHAGSGGHAAGPVARKFVQAMLEQGLLGGGQLPSHTSASIAEGPR